MRVWEVVSGSRYMLALEWGCQKALWASPGVDVKAMWRIGAKSLMFVKARCIGRPECNICLNIVSVGSTCLMDDIK